MDQGLRKCSNCGHIWYPRKPIPPKKCPRCQHPYPASEDETKEHANAAYVENVRMILTLDAKPWSRTIRNTVDRWRAATEQRQASH